MLSSKLKSLSSHCQRYLSSPSFPCASPSSFYDLCIVGGGLVGNAMACSVGQNPWLKFKKVLLIDSSKVKDIAQPPHLYSNRVSAVNPASMEFFQELGIADRLINYRMQKVTDLYVMDSCSRSKIHFECFNIFSPLAYIVENDAINYLIRQKIAETCSNVSVRDCAKVISCSVPSDLSENAQIILSDGSIIESSLLIGADGANSSVRKAMGVGHVSQDYEKMAIVATLKVSFVKNSLRQVAWQRFTPTGPIALLPLTDELCSLVWSTSTEDAHRLMNLPEDQFVDELNNHMVSDVLQDSSTNKALSLMDKICAFLPQASKKTVDLQVPYVVSLQADSRAAFPLSFSYVENYVTCRAALIGDSAHRVHPLAGQGVNLGWYDVQSLVDALVDAVKEGADLGSLTYLRDYDTKSQRHNVPVMRAIDGLNKLYCTNYGPYVFLRSIGIHTLDKLLPIKDLIVHRASI